MRRAVDGRTCGTVPTRKVRNEQMQIVTIRCRAVDPRATAPEAPPDGWRGFFYLGRYTAADPSDALFWIDSHERCGECATLRMIDT